MRNRRLSHSEDESNLGNGADQAEGISGLVKGDGKGRARRVTGEINETITEDPSADPSTPRHPEPDLGASAELSRRSMPTYLAMKERGRSLVGRTVHSPGLFGADGGVSTSAAMRLWPSFDDKIVGTYSCEGAELGQDGVVSKINQDRASMVSLFPGSVLFAVLDGHGGHGEDISEEVVQSLFFELDEKSERVQADPGKMLSAAFVDTNAHLKLMMGVQPTPVVNARASGACTLAIHMDATRLWVANIGDCRAIVGRNLGDKNVAVVELTTDHTVDDPKEKARIEAAGGWVRPASKDEDGFELPARLFAYNGARGPGLRCSRMMGDLDVEHLLSAAPDVQEYTIHEKDEYLVIASDGVWEFLSNEQVMKYVHKTYKRFGSAVNAAKVLCVQSLLKWKEEEGAYRDDISVFVVHLPSACASLEEQKQLHAGTGVMAEGVPLGVLAAVGQEEKAAASPDAELERVRQLDVEMDRMRVVDAEMVHLRLEVEQLRASEAQLRAELDTATEQNRALGNGNTQAALEEKSVDAAISGAAISDGQHMTRRQIHRRDETGRKSRTTTARIDADHAAADKSPEQLKQIISALSAMPPFVDMVASQVQRLAEAMGMTDFAAGQYAMREAELGAEVAFIFVSGDMRTEVGGKEKDTVVPGSLFGEVTCADTSHVICAAT